MKAVGFIFNLLLWNITGKANYFQLIVGKPVWLKKKHPLNYRLLEKKYNYIDFCNGKYSNSKGVNKVLSNIFPSSRFNEKIK